MTVPWFIGQSGAKHPPEVARLLAYAATGGAEGVVGVNDMKVVPYAVPGTGVNIRPGGCVILNRHAGGSQQSYIDRIPVQEDLPLTGTGTGQTRSDLIVRRVEDPQYPGWDVPPDPANADYGFTRVLTGVPPNTRSARELNLGYPAIALARIDWPESTATVTSSMVVDLRKVARPRRERYVRTHALVQGEEDALTAVGGNGEMWPDIANALWRVDVPEWATSARVIATWGSVLYSGGHIAGTVWARIGDSSGSDYVDTQSVRFDAPNVSGTSRDTIVLGDDVAIPASMRGTTQPLRMYGMVTQTGGSLSIDSASSIVFDVEFVERADLA